MRKRKRSLYKLFIILSFVVGVLVGTLAIRQYQLVAGFKYGPESVGAVNVSTGNFEDGTLLVNVTFRTGNDEGKVEPISVIATNLKVTSKSGKAIKAVDVNGNVYNQLVPGEVFSGSQNWKLLVNYVEVSDGNIHLRFLADNETKEGYSSNRNETLYTFWVKGAASKDDLNFEFDNEESLMLSKNRPVTNIWVQ